MKTITQTKPTIVTLKHIAEQANVSIATASKIIGKSAEIKRISPETIRKVSKIAKELGYKPNINARSLAKQKSMIIGVYAAPHPGKRINEFYVSPIIEGISDKAIEYKYDVMLIDFGRYDKNLTSAIEKFLIRRIDGLILINVHVENRIIDNLKEVNMPLVAIDNFAMLPVASVNIDNFTGIYNIVSYLYSLGHRKIAFLGELTKERMPDHIKRQNAFEQVVKDFGIENECIVVEYPQADMLVPREDNYCQEDGYQGVDWLIKARKEFSAVVGYNDLVVLGAMRRLNEENLRIPEEISVVGFDNLSICEYVTPPITSISHPTRQMGEEAVDMLVDFIEHPQTDISHKSVLLKPELIIRKSCGKCF